MAILLFNVETPSDKQMETYSLVVYWITAILFSLGVTIWVCIKKGRSWAWALIFFVPFGWIILLALENKRIIPTLEPPPTTLPPALD